MNKKLMSKLQKFVLYNILFGWLFGWGLPDELGVPCWVMGKEANRVRIVPGRIIINVDQAVDIRYLWVDNSYHAYVAHQDDYVDAINRVPLFLHNVGELFPPGKDVGVGSELWHKILVTSANVKIATAYEDYREGQEGLPWFKIILYVGGAVLLIYLFKTGFIQQLLDGLTNQ